MPSTTSPLIEAQQVELLGEGAPLFDFRAAGPSLACIGAATRLIKVFTGECRSRGRVLVAGLAADQALQRGLVGFAPQALPVPPGTKIEEALSLSSALVGFGSQDVEQALARCEILHLKKRRIGGLNQVEQRLVGLAHGVIGEPGILILENLFDDLSEDSARLLEGVLMRLLIGRRWIAATRIDSASSLRLTLSAEEILEEGSAPVLTGNWAPSAYWVKGIDALGPLAEKLTQEGASVALSPNALVLLVRQKNAQSIYQSARSLKITLAGIAPAESTRIDESRAR